MLGCARVCPASSVARYYLFFLEQRFETRQLNGCGALCINSPYVAGWREGHLFMSLVGA
jgi:hypothetical protein